MQGSENIFMDGPVNDHPLFQHYLFCCCDPVPISYPDKVNARRERANIHLSFLFARRKDNFGALLAAEIDQFDLHLHRVEREFNGKFIGGGVGPNMDVRF